jgi:chromosomal replication initiation ATPase DnaA
MDDDMIAWFESGTVIRLDRADQGLKTSILRLRAKERHIELLDNVTAYLASACSTVRELDCAFNRVFAEFSFRNVQIDLDAIQGILKSQGMA